MALQCCATDYVTVLGDIYSILPPNAATLQKIMALVPLNSDSTVPVSILEVQFLKPVVRHVR